MKYSQHKYQEPANIHKTHRQSAVAFRLLVTFLSVKMPHLFLDAWSVQQPRISLISIEVTFGNFIISSPQLDDWRPRLICLCPDTKYFASMISCGVPSNPRSFWLFGIGQNDDNNLQRSRFLVHNKTVVGKFMIICTLISEHWPSQTDGWLVIFLWSKYCFLIGSLLFKTKLATSWMQKEFHIPQWILNNNNWVDVWPANTTHGALPALLHVSSRMAEVRRGAAVRLRGDWLSQSALRNTSTPLCQYREGMGDEPPSRHFSTIQTFKAAEWHVVSEIGV